MSQKRSLFQMVFGVKEQDQQRYQTQLQLLKGYQARWTNYDGRLYEDAQIRACVDAIARNCAKFNPKHIRETDNGYEQIKGRIHRLISRKPNEMMNAYDFYYKVISLLELENNAFIYIARDEQNIPIGLYPINPDTYTLLEYKGNIYVSFSFNGGQKYTASLKDDVIHLKKFYCKEDIVGSNNAPIIKTMSLKHIVDEGMINAIKTTQSIKGFVKSTKAMLKPEDVAKMREDFINSISEVKDGVGIGGLDATTDFKEVNLNPITATDGQIKAIDDKVLNYFGINQEFIQSKYDENTWNAVYESVLEPIAIQMGLEFTNKIFSYGEIWHGNIIVFEANRLQYASISSKINILKEAGALGILTRNEAREILNLAPVENGDEIIQSLNYTNLGSEANNNE